MRPLDLLIALLRRWVRPTILDAEPVRATAGVVCYVLPRPSSLDRAAVEIAAGAEQLPPSRPASGRQSGLRHLFTLTRGEGWFRQRPSMRRASPK